MGESLDRGVVLVMSIWDDHAAYMLWLDSQYPVDAPPSSPGVSRGSCPTTSGKPEEVESKYRDARVRNRIPDASKYGQLYLDDGTSPAHSFYTRT